MRSIAVEYLRFGDDAGIARLSERYLRTVQSGKVSTVQLNLRQDKLREAMGRLDYVNYRRRNAEAVRNDAETVLRQLLLRLKEFLPELPRTNDSEQLQIEIVTQALELAQLPFEVLEDDDEHLVITRRIRLPWPLPPVARDVAPRVLFAWAEPRGMKVPHDRHRELLDSFLGDWPGSLVELGNASLEALRERIHSQENGFTHVYVLAHGVSQPPVTEAFDLDAEPMPSTYLGLQDGNDVCRCAPKDLQGLFQPETPRPAAFILATCDSGEVNSIHTGGTLAHALQRAGVPVVVASQFELTQAGSDRLVDVFLNQLVSGEDPRHALRLCRDRLRRESKETYYDRVAVVGYIQLDEDTEAQLTECKLKISLARLKAISSAAGREISVLQRGDRADTVEHWEAVVQSFEAVRAGLASIAEVLEKDQGLKRSFEEEAFGLLASSLKREAEAAWRLAHRLHAGQLRAEYVAHSRNRLAEAASAYERAARPSRDRHWVWVQWLVLRTVVSGALPDEDVDWIVAQVAAQDAADIWGLGSLVELQVLAAWLDDAEAKARIESYLDDLVERCPIDKPFPVESTLDQLARYSDWWNLDETLDLPDEVRNRAAQSRAYLENAWKQKLENP